MYTYRVLREEEFYTKNLICKNYYENMPYILLPKLDFLFGEDALDKVFTHIRMGNKCNTTWISSTKDFNNALEHLYYYKYKYVPTYNYKENYAPKDTITGIAFIKNHDRDFFELTEGYKIKYSDDEAQLSSIDEAQLSSIIKNLRNLPLNAIEKCVFDMSNGTSKKFNSFMQGGCVKTKDGRYRFKQEEQEKSYAKRSKEVLILGEIPARDYYILDPLQIDIIKCLIEENKNIDDYLIENLLNKIYIKHDLFFWANVKNFDVTYEEVLSKPLLNIFNNLNDFERETFTKVYIHRKNKIICSDLEQKAIDYILKIITGYFLNEISNCNDNQQVLIRECKM